MIEFPCGRVSDPHNFNADPNPVDQDPTPHQCESGDLWPTDPASPGLHFEPLRLHFERPRPSTALFEPRKLLNFDFNADPDPAFLSNADPIQLPKIMPLPCSNTKRLDIKGFDILVENDRNKFFVIMNLRWKWKLTEK